MTEDGNISDLQTAFRIPLSSVALLYMSVLLLPDSSL